MGANTERQVFVPADHIETVHQGGVLRRLANHHRLRTLRRDAITRDPYPAVGRHRHPKPPNDRQKREVPADACVPDLPGTHTPPPSPVKWHLQERRWFRRGTACDSNIGTTFTKIIEKAGLVPWDKLFQNLRATRETELMASLPGQGRRLLDRQQRSDRHEALRDVDARLVRSRRRRAGGNFTSHFTPVRIGPRGSEHPSASEDALNTRVFTVLAIGDDSIRLPRKDSNLE